MNNNAAPVSGAALFFGMVGGGKFLTAELCIKSKHNNVILSVAKDLVIFWEWDTSPFCSSE
jgi:hypothetical protein